MLIWCRYILLFHGSIIFYTASILNPGWNVESVEHQHTGPYAFLKIVEQHSSRSLDGVSLVHRWGSPLKPRGWRCNWVVTTNRHLKLVVFSGLLNNLKFGKFCREKVWVDGNRILHIETAKIYKHFSKTRVDVSRASHPIGKKQACRLRRRRLDLWARMMTLLG